MNAHGALVSSTRSSGWVPLWYVIVLFAQSSFFVIDIFLSLRFAQTLDYLNFLVEVSNL